MEHITNRSDHDQKCWLVFFLLRLVDTVNHKSVGPNGCNADKEWKWGYSNRSYCINDIIENRKAMVCWCVISWVILQCQISNHIWQFKAYPRERIGILLWEDYCESLIFLIRCCLGVVLTIWTSDGRWNNGVYLPGACIHSIELLWCLKMLEGR